ncbi:MAG: SDR family oxidoreductase [Actinobacteria bacterium]|nr:SDR family oxidoreductase [Actinomycetota bacterium]
MPTAMITGAAGGLGAAIATALAPTHTLFLAGRPSPRLDALADEFGATTWPMDFGDLDGLAAVVEPIDSLDVLVHNAGVAFPAALADSTIDEWRASFEVNVVGAVALTQALLPVLRASRTHVLVVNSGSGLKVHTGMASYSASKFAARAFADSLRVEEPLLRVTSVHPGRVDTPMQERLIAFEGRDYRPADFLRPAAVAEVIAGVVNGPPDAHIHEIVVRPS